MTKYYSVNKEYAAGEGDIAIYDLVNVLTASGWTIQSASNGSNFDAGTTYWSSASWGNLAWVTVREPSGPGGREWCFQRITYDYNWRVKVSPYAGFTGSATATQVPTATDEGIIWGSGTDGSPTGATLFYTSNRFKFHAIAESTPVGPAGNQAYGFWAFHNLASAMAENTNFGLICQEPMAVGSYPALTGSRANTTSGEADPCIYAAAYNASGYSFNLFLHGYGEAQDQCSFKHFYKYQNASGSLTFTYDVGGTSGGSYQLYPRLVNVHPCSGQDTNLPFMVGRMGYSGAGVVNTVITNIGLKGTCNFLKIRGTNRSTGNVINLTTDAYVYVSELLIPWPENIVPEF